MAMRRNVMRTCGIKAGGSGIGVLGVSRLKPLAVCIRALMLGSLIATPAAHAAGNLPVVLPGGRWEGALPPAYQNGGMDMLIQQLSKRATLDWQSFDIGKNYGVQFAQPGSDSVALNRIHANDPSVINGRLTANGQVYLINQNGIVFGKNAQVDVNTLIASTLNIDDAIFEQGILGAYVNDEAAFVADADMPADALIEIRDGARLSASQGDSGRILILAPEILNAGDIETPDGQAILAAARDKVYLTSSTDTDLRGLLVEVKTGGTVTVDDVGSIIAERGNVSILGMSVNQNGLVRATSTVSLNGSIRLVAGDNPSLEDDEKPLIFSGEGLFSSEQGGDLVLGAGSVTEVVPEGSAQTTDSQSQPVSYVDMAGKTVTVESGARVTVTGGQVNVYAGESLANGNYTPTGAPEDGVAIRIESGAVIDVSGDDTTVVPVSRNVIAVEARGNELADSPLQRDGAIRNETLYVDIREGTPFLTIEGAEALIERGVGERLSAGGSITLQSTGDVVVEDGAVLDISGGQITYTGDDVFTSKLVTADGRVFDISEADPSRIYVGILGGDLVIDHAKWGVSEVYDGILGGYQPGYVEGKDAGELLIQARRVSFNGQLLAGSIAGDLQRYAPDAAALEFDYLRPHDQRPDGGSFTLDLRPTEGAPEIVFAEDEERLSDPDRAQPLASDRVTVLSTDMLAESGVSDIDVKTTGSIAVDASLTLPDNGTLALYAGKVDVNQDIRSAGGTVDIKVERNSGTTDNNGILIPDADVALRLASGVMIDVSGRWSNDSSLLNPEPPTGPIVIDGGDIRLTSGGDLVLEQGSVLDVSAGAHLSADGALLTGQGGAIDLATLDNEKLVATELRVEAELRGFAFENGGTLSLTANDVLIAGQSQVAGLLEERLGDGSARYTLEGSGALRSLVDHANNDEQRVLVDPELFRSGGFGAFELTANRGGLDVAQNTTVELTAQNRVPDNDALIGFFTANLSQLATLTRETGNGNVFENVPTGTALDAFTQITELPDYLRAPVDLSLTSEYRFGTAENAEANNQLPVLSLGTGAAILGDPGARIALASDTSLLIDGRIDAPAGDIAVQLGNSYERYAAEQMIWLGPQALLSAAGTVLTTPHELGLRQGEVLDAGSISLQADFGSIVTASGSRIDVDGVATTFDLPSGSGAIAPVVIAGQAGEIGFTAAESILLQGELSGRGALPDAAGGTLAVTLDPTHRPDETAEKDPADFVPLAERYPSGPRIINMIAYTGDLPEPGTAITADLNGQAYVPTEQLASGGFAALDLKVLTPGSGTYPDRPESGAIIRFPEDLTLALDSRITLDAPVLSTEDADVQLSAAYVAIGSTDTRFRLDGSTPIDGGGTTQADPTGGDGQLRIEADLIDLIGDTVTQGFGNGTGAAVDLVSQGDIRLIGTRLVNTTDWEGSLRVAGDLRLQAQQIYPTTLSDFEITVESLADAEGTLEILGQNGQPGQPLSVGGRIALTADNIIVRDGAVVRAPIGEIALGGDYVNAEGENVGAHTITLEGGSLLSTSAAGLSIPFGVTQFEEALVMNIGGNVVPFVADPEGSEKALPEKHIELNADAIDVQDGAQFDLSGGGDIRAVEFIPGPGGSKDILLADLDTGSGVEANSSFAILPLLGGEFAPFDPIDSPAAADVQGIQIGQTLVLEEGIDGLPAGEYAVLPARYALFGGYLVTPVAGTQDLLAGQNQSRLDGVRILAGHLDTAGADLSGSRTQGFAIEDGTRARLRAEYAENSLDALFADSAVRRPIDAGTLTITAGDALTLAGSLVPTLTGGRGSAVDIVANELSILSHPNGGVGVELLASDLEGLNADSLLIGATRELTEDGLVITPHAERIEVADGVNLAMRELILVADSVQLGTDSTQATRLTAAGENTRAADALIVEGNAAVAMVSAKRGATITREADASVAQLTVGAGVILSAAGGSIVLDANGDVQLDGTLDADGATLALGGASVSLGETGGLGLSGLVLSNADLARLSGSDLSLRSSSTVDLYGALADAAGAAHAFERLALDTQGIVGRDNSGDVAKLSADAIELRNRSGVALGTTVAGDGRLELNGGQIVLDSGDFAIQGYGQTVLHASDSVLAQDAGALNVSGALTLATPLLTATGGAERSITTDAALTVTGGDAQAVLPDVAGLGARLTLEAASIDYTGSTVLPSGQFTMNADGAIALNNGANIDVAGRDVVFASKRVGTPGGDIHIESSAAGITVKAGASLDVSGASAGGAAGRIELIAPQGTLTLAPEAVLRAAETGGNQGEFVVDAAQLASTIAADNALSNLNELLQDDFQGRRELRVRNGDLHLESNQVFRAREVRLIADSGRLMVDGSIDASGSDGGSIVLAAGDALDVNGTLDAHATASDGDGGRVEVAALDADGDDLADGTRDDVVTLAAGSVIDVRGGSDSNGGNGGSVLVRALAYDADSNGSKESVAVGALDATVRGAARADVEAVHAYTDTSISSSDMTTWLSALNAFMNSNTVVLPASWRLVPGLQISSTGDLTLASEWDLNANAEDADTANDWRFGADNDVPGILTLLAAGDVKFNQSLTDGFVDDQFAIAQFFFVGDEGIPYERLAAAESWSYRIVAGADTTSADVLATARGTDGDIVVAAGKLVRTGSGDIELVASDDIELGSNAEIYTAGLNSGAGVLQDMLFNLDKLGNLDFNTFEYLPFTGEALLLGYLNLGQFPEAGGDVRITTGGDLVGSGTDFDVTLWQPRIGGDLYDNDNEGYELLNLPTHWAVAYDQFNNGIGVLGGGDLSARVGGDVRNAALALPTSGKSENVVVLSDTDASLVFADQTTAPLVNGGGDLTLEIAGDLLGSVVQVDRGNATVRIGGDLGSEAAAQQPYFAIGDTQLQIETGGDLNLGGVVNSTVIQQAHSHLQIVEGLGLAGPSTVIDPLFFTYGASSTVTLSALAGEVTLQDPLSLVGNDSLSLVAPSLLAHSFQGGIGFAGNLKMYPAAQAQLELLAEDDIRNVGSDATYFVVQSDVNVRFMPTAVEPIFGSETGTPTVLMAPAETPVHAEDTVANLIVSRSGSILGKADVGSLWELQLAKQTHIIAGQDITDMSFKIQHVRDTDVSLVSAGGSILQSLPRATTGSFEGTKKIFRIAGPGRLDVLAGADIDLGSSYGIVSVGNTLNPALADDGADIVVMAGLAEEPDYDAFIQTYLDDSALYLNNLNAFLAARGIAANGDPVGAFRALSRLEQRELILDIFFEELKESGVAATAGSLDYSRGFAAIATLFPEAQTSGDISTPVSVIKTIDQGDIDILAPYGAINAGATFRAIEKPSDELGILAAAGGDINVFLDGDLQVNRERVFALQGDLIGWSSHGGIDAGKGAKTITSIPDPIFSVDASGNTIVTFPPAVDGSGLSAVNAYLFAPNGVINAGDAGIRIQGNLTLGATEVLGADNIDVGGVSVGVPTAASVPVGAVDAGAVSSSAASLAEESTSSLGGDDADQQGGETLGLLSVELLGFGSESDCNQSDANCKKQQ